MPMLKSRHIRTVRIAKNTENKTQSKSRGEPKLKQTFMALRAVAESKKDFQFKENGGSAHRKRLTLVNQTVLNDVCNIKRRPQRQKSRQLRKSLVLKASTPIESPRII